MNNWKNSILIPAMLVLVWFVPAAYPQQPSAPAISAKSSQTPDIRAVRSDGIDRHKQNALAACGAAVDDLIATRTLAEALDAENDSLKKRLETEKRAAALMRELGDTRKSENAALVEAISAKNQAIAAKDVLIASQDKLIGELKRKRTSTWRRLGDILIGAAIAAIVK